MRLVPTHPSSIASFSYDEMNRTLSAHHANGGVTICHDVPEAMFHVLEKTETPDEFFSGYITLQYGCETVPFGDEREVR